MPRGTLITAIDLGTSATTACHIVVNDSFTQDGKLHRERGKGKVTNIRDWPGGNIGDAIGNVCVPTDLIYSKADRKLLYWGFQAQEYLDDPYSDIARDTVFVVEHIKLLLLDPDNTETSTPASRRYRELRNKLIATLGKQPEDVFEDFLNEVIAHIIGSAHRKYFNGISSLKVELVLAFPSGWPDFLHTRVAGIGARAMAKAISANNLQNMVFGIENVYTVSETLCGVKEWFRDTLTEIRPSIDLDPLGTNLDELNEGDCFLPVDLGGGTGCMTPLRLVAKEPLRIDQLAPTQSLQVSGETVEAEFEAWLRSQITSNDYPEDIPELVYQICRKFKEEKKSCGLPPRPGSTTWNISASRLRENPDKGFGKGHMKIERRLLEKCFDPVIDILEAAISEMLRKVEGIKTIVFLGQFGSSSMYIRKRMAASRINGLAKLRHSDSGKLNVVRGAMSERLDLSAVFVRKSQTLKSYGTLITLRYFPGSEAAILFPDARKRGAVPFECDAEGDWLKVVEWEIPQGTTLENGQTCGTSKDAQKHYHTWPRTKNEEIEFEDSIIVSEEATPAPQLNGRSYTLWTDAHQKNQLVVNGRKVDVQRIEFSWSLSMSQKLDAAGNYLGAYEEDDLESYRFPEEYRKGRRRQWLRRLHYELIWDITEMQVKLHVRALFPNPPGPLTTQLAKQHPLEPLQTSYSGESRSEALERDIRISEAGILGPRKEAPLLQQNGDIENGDAQEDLTGFLGPAGTHLMNESARQPRHQLSDLDEVPGTTSSTRIILHLMRQNLTSPINEPNSNAINELRPSLFDRSKRDGRHREGCYTCKARKKRCDQRYMTKDTNGVTNCQTCVRYKLDCHMESPGWNEAQLKAKLVEWKGKVKLGKRKARGKARVEARGEARGDAHLSDTAPRDRPETIDPAELAVNTGTVRNIAPVAAMG